MATTIRLRRDSAADWTSANPTLALGEAGYETDTGKLKIGDGATAWTSLGYFASGVWQIYKHTTSDGGATWDSGEQLTQTTRKAIRPYVVRGHNGTQHLLYLRGTYTSYTSYAARVVLRTP